MNTELFKELKTFCKNKGLEEREAAYLFGLFTKHNEALRQQPVVGRSEQLTENEEETKCPDHTPYWGVCSTCGEY